MKIEHRIVAKTVGDTTQYAVQRRERILGFFWTAWVYCSSSYKTQKGAQEFIDWHYAPERAVS